MYTRIGTVSDAADADLKISSTKVTVVAVSLRRISGRAGERAQPLKAMLKTTTTKI